MTIEGKYQFWRALDHLAGGKAPAQRFAVQRQRLSAPSTSSTKPIKTIPEVRDLSDAEFHAQYVQQARPVVLKGKAAKWPCVQKWSMDWLREQHGEDRVDIFDPSASNEVNYDVEVTTLVKNPTHHMKPLKLTCTQLKSSLRKN